MDYSTASCYNDFEMDVNDTPRNDFSWLTAGAAVCVVLFIGVMGALWLTRDKSAERDADGDEEFIIDQDEGDFDDEAVAGVTDESDEMEDGDGDIEDSVLEDDGEEPLEPEPDEGSGGDVVPVRPPIFVPALPPPDPAQAEFAGSYLPIHQLDSKTHRDDVISFVPAGYKNEGPDLTVHLDYVPPTNPYVNKTVMGFAPYWSLSNYTEYQMERLSIIAYFSVAVYPDGSFVTVCYDGYCGDKSGWDGWNSVQLAGMVAQAHEEGVKVVLTIKNFDKPSIETLVTSPTAQSTLINNIIAEVNAKNVDGVNIDYEYIGSATPELRAAFAASMDAIADAVHAVRPGSHVSTDILGSSAMNGSSLIYDVTALGQTSLDAIMVMAYDFHSTSYYPGKMAAPTSPLYGNQYWYTVSEAMSDIIARAPAGKVIMGVPYYGLEFPVSGETWGSKNASVIGSGAITTYENVTDPIFDAWHNDSTIQWDDNEKMTWYRYRWPDAVSGPNYWQGYYDDARSLRAKYEYVQAQGIGGIGVWALGYDAGRTELWDVMRDVFSMEPVIVLFHEGVTLGEQQAVCTALSTEVVRVLANGRGMIVRPLTMTSQALINQLATHSEVSNASFLPYRSLHEMDELQDRQLIP